MQANSKVMKYIRCTKIKHPYAPFNSCIESQYSVFKEQKDIEALWVLLLNLAPLAVIKFEKSVKNQDGRLKVPLFDL